MKLQGFATTLTNSIAGVAAKVMVAIFSGENLAGVVVFFPGSDALSAKLGAVVRAAGVDGVHVGHQNLPEQHDFFSWTMRVKHGIFEKKSKMETK